MVDIWYVQLIVHLRDFINKNPNKLFNPELKNVINKYDSVINKVEENADNFSITIEACTEKLARISERLGTIFPE